jgi:hypothetical protein
MCDEENISWSAYGAACLKNIIWSPSVLARRQEAEVAALNTKEKIFLSAVGDLRNLWHISKEGAFEPMYPDVPSWRECSNSTRQEVHYYGGEWGWMSNEERSQARRDWPRTAP